MDLNSPLPRLLRLRGMVVRSVPADDAKIAHVDAPGLIDAYNRLRDSARAVATDLQLDVAEFDREFPALQPVNAGALRTDQMVPVGALAKSAATSLRSRAGYVEGLIEAVVLEQRISMEQVEAAREAARQPPGFR